MQRSQNALGRQKSKTMENDQTVVRDNFIFKSTRLPVLHKNRVFTSLLIGISKPTIGSATDPQGWWLLPMADISHLMLSAFGPTIRTTVRHSSWASRTDKERRRSRSQQHQDRHCLLKFGSAIAIAANWDRAVSTAAQVDSSGAYRYAGVTAIFWKCYSYSCQLGSCCSYSCPR